MRGLKGAQHSDGRSDERGHIESGWFVSGACGGVPRMVATAAARGLFAGDPDAKARAGLGCLECEVAGGGGRGEVVQMARELRGGNVGFHLGEVEAKLIWHGPTLLHIL